MLLGGIVRLFDLTSVVWAFIALFGTLNQQRLNPRKLVSLCQICRMAGSINSHRL